MVYKKVLPCPKLIHAIMYIIGKIKCIGVRLTVLDLELSFYTGPYLTTVCQKPHDEPKNAINQTKRKIRETLIIAGVSSSHSLNI